MQKLIEAKELDDFHEFPYWFHNARQKIVSFDAVVKTCFAKELDLTEVVTHTYQGGTIQDGKIYQKWELSILSYIKAWDVIGQTYFQIQTR